MNRIFHYALHAAANRMSETKQNILNKMARIELTSFNCGWTGDDQTPYIVTESEPHFAFKQSELTQTEFNEYCALIHILRELTYEAYPFANLTCDLSDSEQSAIEKLQNSTEHPYLLRDDSCGNGAVMLARLAYISALKQTNDLRMYEVVLSDEDPDKLRIALWNVLRYADCQHILIGQVSAICKSYQSEYRLYEKESLFTCEARNDNNVPFYKNQPALIKKIEAKKQVAA